VGEVTTTHEDGPWKRRFRSHVFSLNLKGVFKPTPDASMSFLMSHTFSKWVFDLFRNAMIAGVLKYLSDKSNSWILWIASEVAFAALLFYCLSYVNTWMLQPFHPMKNQRVAFWLNLCVTLLIVFPLWFAVVKGVPAAIEAIAHGRAK
jgi:type IV secretory pathway VirB6-like protein